MAILACYTPERPILGITEIADELRMSRSTTHRYAATLVRLGYLVRDSQHRYRLTLAVSDLGLSALNSISLEVHSRPHLEELRQQTGFGVAVGVLDGAEVLIVARFHGRRREELLARCLPTGGLWPGYCTALGKLLLASLGDAPQRVLLEEIAFTARRGPNAIKSKTALRRELKGIRKRGLVVAEEELAAGVLEIAAPVRDSHEIVAAVGIEAHSSMIQLEDFMALGPHLIATADRISARLGYRRADERTDGYVAPYTHGGRA